MRRRTSVLLAAAAAVSLVAPATGLATTVPGAPVFPPGEEPFGLPYDRWAADYSRWVVAGTAGTAPVLHPNRCGPGRSPRVVYLPAIPGGRQRARCTVAPNTALFITPSSVIYNDAPSEPGGSRSTPRVIRAAAVDGLKTVRGIRLTVDGKMIRNPRSHRFVTPFYEQSLPAGNVFGVEPGRYTTVAAGYWFMIRPLPRGVHTVVALASDPLLQGGFAELTIRVRVR